MPRYIKDWTHAGLSVLPTKSCEHPMCSIFIAFQSPLQHYSGHVRALTSVQLRIEKKKKKIVECGCQGIYMTQPTCCTSTTHPRAPLCWRAPIERWSIANRHGLHDSQHLCGIGICASLTTVTGKNPIITNTVITNFLSQSSPWAQQTVLLKVPANDSSLKSVCLSWKRGGGGRLTLSSTILA